jgi:predicted Zn-dependent protease
VNLASGQSQVNPRRSPNWQSEIAIGRQTARNLRVTLTDDPDIAEYFNRIGQNVLRHSDATIPFTVRVIDSNEINALPLPGGFLYVTTGLILAADNEAELAGLIAHQIAHITAHHGTGREDDRAFYAGLPVELLAKAAALNVPLTFLRFRPEAELEADLLAMQYIIATGYDPMTMVTLSERLQSQPSTNISLLFNTHSQNPERVEQIRRRVAGSSERSRSTGFFPTDFETIRKRVADLSSRRSL